MTLLTARTQPQWCPCCWDKTHKGAYCFADCLPFTFVGMGDAASLSGDYSTCRSNAAGLPSWAQPTYTPVADKIYATTAQNLNSCTYYFLQYCRANAAGNRGVSWVVEYFCQAFLGTTVSHLIQDVPDWLCTCDGARYSFDFGQSGTGTVPDFGCCPTGATGTGTVVGTDSHAPCCSSVPSPMTLALGGCINTNITLTSNGTFTSGTSSGPQWTGFAYSAAGFCISARYWCATNSSTGVVTHFVTIGCSAVPPFACSAYNASSLSVSADFVSVVCSPFSITGTFSSGFGASNACCSGSPSSSVPFVLS